MYIICKKIKFNRMKNTMKYLIMSMISLSKVKLELFSITYTSETVGKLELTNATLQIRP